LAVNALASLVSERTEFRGRATIGYTVNRRDSDVAFLRAPQQKKPFTNSGIARNTQRATLAP
jgi:hypothetical protein